MKRNFVLLTTVALLLALGSQTSEAKVGLDGGISSQRLLTQISDIETAFKERDVELLNRQIEPIVKESSGLRFLKDIKFEFKTFDVGNGKSGLGFKYDYDRAFASAYKETRDDVTTGSQWNFLAKGNVAFDKDINPADFLETGFGVRYFLNSGGITTRSSEALARRLQEILRIRSKLGPNELETDPTTKELYNYQAQLGSQVYLDARLDTSLESNQDFSTKQYTYGVKVGLDYKAWRPDSWQAKANVFDYPFALLRMLSGVDNSFEPKGSAWPSVLVSLDRVSPQDNDPRALAGDTSDYNRLQVEVAFRTPIARIRSGRIHFNADYRYFKELDASNVVRAANLASYDYFVATISSTNGVFVSYSNGKLPFDLKDQEVYELGIKFQLK